MEVVEAVKPAKKSKDRQSYLKKIDPESAKLLSQLKDRANKKPYGRKVREAEILARAIRLVDQEDLKVLQEQTYSERDRLNMAHEEFVKAHGKISLDQFIGKLIRGELPGQMNLNGVGHE